MDRDGGITLQIDQAVAWITINRPWVKNAFTVKMWERLGSRVAGQKLDQLGDFTRPSGTPQRDVAGEP